MKNIFMLFLLLLLVGCTDSKSVKDCKMMGFKGIVLDEVSTSSSCYCSNGLIVSDSGNPKVITSAGMLDVKWTTYKPVIEHKLVFLDFTKGLQDFKEVE